MHEVFKLLRFVVNHGVSAQRAHYGKVLRAGGGGHGSAQVLGQLDGDGADAA